VRSTIVGMLARHGRLRCQRSRRECRRPGAAPLRSTAATRARTSDFMRRLRTRDGAHAAVRSRRRLLLCCQHAPDLKVGDAQRERRRFFHQFGLQPTIRSHDGAPLVSNGTHGLNCLKFCGCSWASRISVLHRLSARERDARTHKSRTKGARHAAGRGKCAPAALHKGHQFLSQALNDG